MAAQWDHRWQVCFQSRTGTQYAVNIYEWNNAGNVTRLTGAAEPFVTQEDNDDDIFVPIRTQTGYLRVIDETQSGNLLESLMPTNNTQKLVRLYSGTYSSNTFTEGAIEWQGFLCAEAFTQPWDKSKKLIEFPVKSLLAALQDVQIQEIYAATEKNIATMIVHAFSRFHCNPSNYIISSHLSNQVRDFLRVKTQNIIFFKEEEINNEGDSYKQLAGLSYYEVMKYICELFGLCLREIGDTLCFASYDRNGGRIYYKEWTYDDIYLIGADIDRTGGASGWIDSVNMLDVLEFRGSDNFEGFVQGGKSAKVVLTLSGLTFYLDLPQTTESTDQPVEINLKEGNGKLYVQVHTPRSERESTTFLEYSRYTLIGSSDYQTMLQHTVLNGYTWNPYASADTHLYTGAFPCRFFHKENDTDFVKLKNGIYLNMQYKTSNNTDPFVEAACYSVTSFQALNAQQGWLNIQFMLQSLVNYTGTSSPTPEWIFGNLSQFYNNEDIHTEVYMCLQVGSYFWNGTTWVLGSAPNDSFWFRMVNGKVPNNKTADMNTDEDDGYFIPITMPLVGFVTFHLLNVAIVTHDNPHTYLGSYTHILSDLNIKHVLPKSIVASERLQNTYRQTITEVGFSEDKEIELKLGTMNNNIQTPSFVKRDSSTYIESLNYYTSSSTEDQRPELHLLSRMVTQYGVVRRTLKAIVSSGLQMMTRRYYYLGKYFFGIDAKHNWRDDEQEVKFIEVS